jgi:hypothetical protein
MQIRLLLSLLRLMLSAIVSSNHASHGGQLLLQLLAFLQCAVSLLYDLLQLLERLLVLQFFDAVCESVNCILRSLANSPLRFPIVCSLLLELLRRQIGHASTAWGRR